MAFLIVLAIIAFWLILYYVVKSAVRDGICEARRLEDVAHSKMEPRPTCVNLSQSCRCPRNDS